MDIEIIAESKDRNRHFDSTFDKRPKRHLTVHAAGKQDDDGKICVSTNDSGRFIAFRAKRKRHSVTSTIANCPQVGAAFASSKRLKRAVSFIAKFEVLAVSKQRRFLLYR